MPAPGWDVYVLEQEWRVWLADNEFTPNRPEKNFLKFCASWHAKRGRAWTIPPPHIVEPNYKEPYT